MLDNFHHQIEVMVAHPAEGRCACDPYQDKWCAFHADYDERNPNSSAYVLKHPGAGLKG